MTSALPTALITGAAGQDGALLSALLVARGHRVVGVVRPGTQDALAGDERRSALLRGCELYSLDLTRPGELREALHRVRPDEVYHLAAAHHSSEGGSVAGVADWQKMTAVNFAAAEVIVATVAAELPETRVVLASSSQIWTPDRVDHLVEESTPWQPSTYYGRTKSWAMDCLRHYRMAMGIHGCAAILFNHESPLRAQSFVTRRVSRLAAAVRLGASPTLHLRNIGARVDWTDARDVVEALRRAGAPGAPGECIVASGISHSIRDLLDAAFAGVAGGWEAHVTYDRDEPTASLLGMPALAERSFGWKSAVSFDELIARMVDADMESLAGRNL